MSLKVRLRNFESIFTSGSAAVPHPAGIRAAERSSNRGLQVMDVFLRRERCTGFAMNTLTLLPAPINRWLAEWPVHLRPAVPHAVDFVLARNLHHLLVPRPRRVDLGVHDLFPVAGAR